MPRARDPASFGDVRLEDDGKGARITATRYSDGGNAFSPLLRHVKPGPDGAGRIVEETSSEAKPPGAQTARSPAAALCAGAAV